MSWIIVNRETGCAVAETFSKKNADAINTAKYEAKPAGRYLAELNAAIKANGGAV